MNFFADFLDKLRKFGLEWYDRYYSIYPAIVEDVADPENRGRIKVSLPSLMNGQALAQWVTPAHAGIAGKNTGSFFPPYKGDIVDVFFQNGDINFPRYTGGFWAKGELPAEFQAGSRGWVFKNGHKILIDEGGNKISIIHSGGSSVVLDAAGVTVDSKGTVTVNAAGAANVKAGGPANVEAASVSVKSQGTVMVEASGSADVKAGGKVTVKGSNIELDGGGGASEKVLTNPSTLSDFTGAPLMPGSSTVKASK